VKYTAGAVLFPRAAFLDAEEEVLQYRRKSDSLGCFTGQKVLRLLCALCSVYLAKLSVSQTIIINDRMHSEQINGSMEKIIIIFINCKWVDTRWQWLFYVYTECDIDYY
jgi:hypothetical protein